MAALYGSAFQSASLPGPWQCPDARTRACIGGQKGLQWMSSRIRSVAFPRFQLPQAAPFDGCFMSHADDPAKGGLTRRQFLMLTLPAALAACDLIGAWPARPSATGVLPVPVALRNRDVYFEAMQGIRSPDAKETRTLKQRALILAGGNNEASNHLAFYLDAVIWYYFLVHIMRVHSEDIRVLFFDGERPTRECIMEKCHCDSQRTQAAQVLDSFPILYMPVHGAITREAILSELASLRDEALDRSLVISVMHGTIDIVSGVDLPQGGDLSSAWMVLDGLVHDYEFTHALRHNRSGQVISLQANCAARFFLNQAEELNNLCVFTSNGEGGRGEIAQLHALSFWSTALRYVILNAPQFDGDGDGALSFLETQQGVLNLDMPNLLEICEPLSGYCSPVHPGLRVGADLNPADCLFHFL